MFNSDIQKALRKADLTVVDCNTASKTAIEPQIKTHNALALTGVESLSLPDISRAGEDNLVAGKIALSDAAFVKNMSRLVGVNLLQFAGEVPFLDSRSLDTAKLAHKTLGDLEFANVSGLDGRTITKQQEERLLQTIGDATAAQGWTAELADALGGATRAIAAYQAAHRSESGKNPGPADIAPIGDVSTLGTAVIDSLQAVREKSTFAAYFKAYFRNGEIFEVKFDSSGLQQTLIDTIKKELEEHGGNADGQLIDKLTKEIESVNQQFQDKLCKKGASDGSCTVLGAIGEQTFVTRAGKSYGFPGVSATFDPTANKKVSTNKLQTNSILEDLLRVLIEATGDAKDPVPGVPNSTLCKELGVTAAMEAQVCAQEGDKQIQHVNDVGDATEAGTAQVVSVVVRGGWLFSLNNEAIADSLTVGISVGMRKFAERVAYEQAKGTGNCPKPGHRTLAVNFKGP